METQPNLDDKEMEFEFPQVNGDGTDKYKLNKMNATGVDGLQALAKRVTNISSHGKKKNQLLNELKAFSLDRSQWNLVQRGAQRAHKGSQKTSQTDGVKKRPQARSQVRLDLLMNKPATSGDEAVRKAIFKSDRTKWLLWANNLHKEFPEYQEPRSGMNNSGSENEQMHVDNIETRCTSWPLTPLTNTTISATSTQAVSAAPMADPSPTNRLLAPSTNTTISATSTQAIRVVSMTDLSPTNWPLASSTNTIPLAPNTVTPTVTTFTPFTKEMRKSFVLANGETVSFTRSEVGNAPNVSSRDIIDQLGELWCDEMKDTFKGEKCAVQINGYGVALKYWPWIFGHEVQDKSDSRWKAMKGKWNKWKFVAFEYLSASSPDEFWKKWTDEKGQQMTFTAISDALLAQRNASGQSRNTSRLDRMKDLCPCAICQSSDIRFR